MSGANFSNAQDLGQAIEYVCGWCNRNVAASRGWLGETRGWGRSTMDRWFYIALCPNCHNPTSLVGDRQYPGARFGDNVEHLPEDVSAAYAEARSCVTQRNYTAAVMIGRKLLMHVAVEKGADAGRQFAFYVDWLVEQHIITPDMKAWVDEIRELGNDANHDLPSMSKEEAEALITFVSLLLRIVYEFPERGRLSVQARRAKEAPPEAEESAPSESTGFDGGVRGSPPPVLGS